MGLTKPRGSVAYAVYLSVGLGVGRGGHALAAFASTAFSYSNINMLSVSVRRKSSLSLVPLVHHAKAKRCNKPRTPGCEDAAVGRSSEQTTKKTKPRIYIPVELSMTLQAEAGPWTLLCHRLPSLCLLAARCFRPKVSRLKMLSHAHRSIKPRDPSSLGPCLGIGLILLI